MGTEVPAGGPLARNGVEIKPIGCIPGLGDIPGPSPVSVLLNLVSVIEVPGAGKEPEPG